MLTVLYNCFTLNIFTVLGILFLITNNFDLCHSTFSETVPVYFPPLEAFKVVQNCLRFLRGLQLTSSTCYISVQEQRMHALQGRVAVGEQALAALEKTATEQMEGLTQQSSSALDRVQRQLAQAYSQLEQLRSFIKVLYYKLRDENLVTSFSNGNLSK